MYQLLTLNDHRALPIVFNKAEDALVYLDEEQTTHEDDEWSIEVTIENEIIVITYYKYDKLEDQRYAVYYLEETRLYART